MGLMTLRAVFTDTVPASQVDITDPTAKQQITLIRRGRQGGGAEEVARTPRVLLYASHTDRHIAGTDPRTRG